MIGKVVLSMLLIGSAAAEFRGFSTTKKPSWLSDMKRKAFSNAKSMVIGDADLIKTKQLMKDAKFELKSCGTTGHAMDVSETAFDIETMALKVKGDLKRDVLGGKVHMKLKLGKAPPGLSTSQKFKRHVAWSMGAKKRATEDLCSHLDRQMHQRTCPLKAGAQEMLFGLHRLPYAISAGKFHLELNAVDDAGEHVACIKGELDVPRGPNGEVFRRLEEAVASSSIRTTSGLFGMIAAGVMILAGLF